MLRIITEQRGKTCRMELHGTIAGEGLEVLERHWRGVLDRTPAAHITVGLTNVAFIDVAGETLLRRMAEYGVEFDGARLMNRYVMQKIAGDLS
jgi:hypothetical protein